ncbi:hypothetical protein HK405_014792 [Cladochytrium tenue]|nr:hypothetical protein HK405_014792 [Cladochytrium tenue]
MAHQRTDSSVPSSAGVTPTSTTPPILSPIEPVRSATSSLSHDSGAATLRAIDKLRPSLTAIDEGAKDGAEPPVSVPMLSTSTATPPIITLSPPAKKPSYLEAARSLVLRSLAEALGMFVFLFLALGGVQAALARSQAPALEIAVVFGLGLATAIALTYRISGGALNPAVNFGLAIAGAMPVSTALAYTVAQCAGGIAGCALVSALFDGPNGKSFKGANTIQSFTDPSTGASVPACTPVQALFIEAVLTMGLVLTVLFQAVEKHRATFMAPLTIGLYVFIAHLISLPYTNTSINPARSLGASVVTGVWSDHWIFWAGPAIGGLLAGSIHRFFKGVKYTTLNPGQDADSDADAAKPLLTNGDSVV